MTFVLSLQTRDSLWLVADRRLSAPERLPIDDALKVATVEATDGLAIISYAGLGRTASGTEPSTWISNTLRGQRGTVEELLGVLANAMRQEFVPHMKIRGSGVFPHSMVIPAFVGKRQCIYSIDLVVAATEVRFRYTRHIWGGALLPMQIPATSAIAGSGAAALIAMGEWRRPILRLIGAYNRKRVSAMTVSDHLARLCYDVYRNTADGTVGPRCVVVWRNAKGSAYRGGGANAFYTEGQRDQNGPVIPSIANGMDVAAISTIIMKHSWGPMVRELQAMVDGETTDGAEMDDANERINQEIAGLPTKPDWRLK